MERKDTTISKMTSVLIPVVIGSLLSLIVSLATNYYTFRGQQFETIRKERIAHLERAMTLTAKYSTDVGKALGIGIITKGNATPNDLAVLSAPTDTLMELRTVVLLYFPKLRSEVDQIHVAHGVMIQRLDSIIGTHDGNRPEDAATFNQRMQKETAPTMEHVRSLMQKLTDLAQDNHA